MTVRILPGSVVPRSLLRVGMTHSVRNALQRDLVVEQLGRSCAANYADSDDPPPECRRAERAAGSAHDSCYTKSRPLSSRLRNKRTRAPLGNAIKQRHSTTGANSSVEAPRGGSNLEVLAASGGDAELTERTSAPGSPPRAAFPPQGPTLETITVQAGLRSSELFSIAD